ncbi:MAG TPA: NACHT domain-containing protein [Thermoanaerobaculia bacterium]
MPADLTGATSLSSIIRDAFASVFQAVNRSTETWYQRFKLEELTRDRYAEHILRTVGVFPLFGTTKTASVESSYVRAAVSSDIERYRYRSESTITMALERQRNGKLPEPERHVEAVTLLDVLDSGKANVALVGNPGSGKTTALRYVAVEVAKGHTLRRRRMLPIFLALRDMSARTLSIAQAAIEFLEWLQLSRPEDVLAALLSKGRILLLIDGLDEIDQTYQVEILKELQTLTGRYAEALFCVSARPYSADVAMPAFEKWETLPFSFPERVTLVRKWFGAMDAPKGERLLRECAQTPSLLDLGSNPLLLSIVCALYYNDLEIPADPDELYDRMIEGLLGRWDAFRNVARQTPLRPLGVRRRVVLVSLIAAEMCQRDKVVFTARDMDGSGALKNFWAANKIAAPPFDDVLTSLYQDFGVLQERAPGKFSFSHLTLQEYLAVRYFVDNRRELAILRGARRSGYDALIPLIARVLTDATDFMNELVHATDLASRHDVRLLADTWRMRPICAVNDRLKIMRGLVHKLRSEVSNLKVSYRCQGPVLYVKIPDHRRGSIKPNLSSRVRTQMEHNLQTRRRQIETKVATLGNLAAIVDLIQASGCSFAELDIDNVTPFNLITISEPFVSVEIDGW